MTVDWQALLERLRGFAPAALDYRNPGAWSLPARAGALASTLVLVLGGGYGWFIAGSLERLDVVQRQEQDLRYAYVQKAAEAAALPAHRARNERIERELTTLLEQMSRDAEIPRLLEDITGAAADTELLVRSIDLQEELRGEFYVELPIAMSVEGAYHDIGAFTSRLARLPRIITLHDFDLGVAGSDGGVRMNVLAKSYRYWSPEKDGAK